jgi:5-methylthioadenosine/S-adenosylhomocysteine deaminase
MTKPEKAMSDLIVQARWLVRGIIDRNSPDIVDHGAVLSRDGTIVATGGLDDMQRLSPTAPVIKYPTHMMLPGFINAHHHVGLTPLQLGSPDHALEYWFATRISGREIDFYLDALYSAFEMIASGTTTVQHIQGWMPGPLSRIQHIASETLRAYKAIGMRASYSWAARQQNHFVYEDNAQFCSRLPPALGAEMLAWLKTFEIAFEDNFTLFDTLAENNADQQLIRIQLSPGNLQWLTDQQLHDLHVRATAAKVPLHMHLVETQYQAEYARRRTGTTALQHLYNLGLLGPHLTLGHCVWFSEQDVEIAADTGTCICHNCSSNFRLRSGMAPANAFENKGMVVAIGLDEAGINDDRDMLQEMRLVLRVHRTPGLGENVPTCPQVLRMATESGAKTTPFGDKIGKLEAGRFFDAVLIDYDKATYPYQDEDIPPLDVVIQRAKTNAVSAVYINGELICENGTFTRLDRDEILEEMRAKLTQPRTPYDIKMRHMGKDVAPFVRQFYENYVPD